MTTSQAKVKTELAGLRSIGHWATIANTPRARNATAMICISTFKATRSFLSCYYVMLLTSAGKDIQTTTITN